MAIKWDILYCLPKPNSTLVAIKFTVISIAWIGACMCFILRELQIAELLQNCDGDGGKPKLYANPLSFTDDWLSLCKPTRSAIDSDLFISCALVFCIHLVIFVLYIVYLIWEVVIGKPVIHLKALSYPFMPVGIVHMKLLEWATLISVLPVLPGNMIADMPYTITSKKAADMPYTTMGKIMMLHLLIGYNKVLILLWFLSVTALYCDRLQVDIQIPPEPPRLRSEQP